MRVMVIVGVFFANLITILVIAVVGDTDKRESSRSILFKQECIELNGKLFRMLKIRCLCVYADEHNA